MTTAMPKTPMDVLERAYALQDDGMETMPAHSLLGHSWREDPPLRDSVRALKAAGLLRSVPGHPGFLQLD